MLRGAATPTPTPPPHPSRLEAGAGAHHSAAVTVGSYARHMNEIHEQPPPVLTFESHQEGLSSRRTTNNSTESSSSSNSASNYHRQHQRQLSAPSFSARRPNAPSLPPSQPHSPKHISQGMPLTGDRRGGNSPGRPSGRSTPVEYDAASFSYQPRTPATAADTTPKSAAAQSRLGFLASSVSAFTSRMTSPTQTPTRTDDELCDLDIEAALYPASAPLDGDAFSPAAYKNLQTNAAGLLRRMQDAYRRRTAALRELQAEREAQREEREEMEMRTLSFKMQLESMAAKAAEQEQAMQQLVAELQAEKRARLEERAISREKMFRVGGSSSVGGEEGSVVGNEDLCVDEDERKRWRASNSTVKSDMSIDSDSAAESESIFSRSRSPTAMTCLTESESILDVPAPSPSPSVSVSLSLPPHPPPSLHPRTAAALPKTKSAQQLTAFQRLVKGMGGSGGENHAGSPGVSECRNCRGQDSSVAWNTVSLLRDENSGLKQRVAHLEVAVEGALDVVNGIKI
ncbi:hypothetical protein F5Y10DRAFT_265530 [Nemania abortiva]|nr:hypothetical protein F5Y10DRAFT_265530 [Nemania abortiva]